MPANRKLKKRIADAFRADKDDQVAAQRYLCSHLKFYIACGRKQCVREHACVGNAKECFERIWPIVPEDMKIGLRAGIEAKRAGLSQSAIVAEIEREMARWREMTAPRTASEPAKQAQPTAPAASGPRLRVL